MGAKRARGADGGGAAERSWLVALCGVAMVEAPDGQAVTLVGAQVPAVLAVLALADGPVVKERVAEAVWGEDLSPHWGGALRGLVTRLRRSLAEVGLDPAAVVSDGRALALVVPGTLTTDVGRASEDLDAATVAAADGDHAEAAHRAGSAARVLARPFLPMLDTEWSLRWRLNLETLAERAARVEVAALIAVGRLDEAVRRARSHLDDHELDEPVHHLLIEALLADGRQGDALRAYAALEQVLSTELSITPAPHTTALLADIASSPVRRPRWGGGRHDGPFVGRSEELVALEAAWAEVVDAARPVLVVLEGPAGIGKTRLVRQLAAGCAAAGAPVAWGRALAGDRRAFSPMIDLLDDAIDADPGILRRTGGKAAGLTPLLPTLAPGAGDGSISSDDRWIRNHLFTAARAVMATFAERPALAVLDDVQWAPVDGIALLDACLDGLDRPLLVVATTRPRAPGEADPLAATAGSVATERIPMTPLGVDEVTELLMGHAAPFTDTEHRTGSALHGRTGGLPFFVNEVRRSTDRGVGHHLDPGSVPEVVRAWVGSQVAALPPFLVEVLETAAVIGERVDVGLLGRSLTDQSIDLAAAVDGLVVVGLLHDEGAGTVSFVHAMTLEAVADGLGPGRRAQLHAQVAAALAERLPGDGRSAELAHHYARAGPGSRGRSAALAERAGTEAMAVGAWLQAEARFGEALAAAEVEALRVRAMIGLGQSRLRQARFVEARTVLEEAEARAARSDLPFERADAVLALVGRSGRGVATDRPRQARQLRAAVVALESAPPGGDENKRRRQVLLSHLERELAVSLLFTAAASERDALLVSALERARSAAPVDEACRAAALLAQRMGSASHRPLARRLDDSAQVLARPTPHLPPDLRLLASCYRHADLLQAGRHEAAAEVLTTAEALVGSYPDPYWRWATATWRALGLVIAGDLDAAEQAAFAAAALLPGVPEAEACLGVNLCNLRLYQRRSGEVVGALAEAAERHPEIPCYRAVLALCAAEAGDLASAEEAYRWFATEGFANLPDDTNRLLGLAVLAHVAADLDDGDGVDVLAELLAPHRGEWVVLDCYGGGGASWGPVAYALARLAQAAGRPLDAEVLFVEAAEQARSAPLVLERIAAHHHGGVSR